MFTTFAQFLFKMNFFLFLYLLGTCRGMDIFWNYTICISHVVYEQRTGYECLKSIGFDWVEK